MSLFGLFLIFVGLLIFLLLISLSFQKNFYLFLLLLTKNKYQAVHLFSLFLLPGTIIHEVAHMLTAEILQVPTGEFSFIPEIKESQEVRVGSLKISRSGLIRRTLIGLAPLIIGLAILTTIFYFQFLPLLQNPQEIFNQKAGFWWLAVFSCCLIFIVSNTMFSSKKDLEPAFFPFLLILLVQIAFWLGGIKLKISLEEKTYIFLANVLTSINSALVFTIVVDLIFLLATQLLIQISKKTLKSSLSFK